MDAGGFAGVNFTQAGGSAFTNMRRPSPAVTEVIWAAALLLKPNKPAVAAENKNVARMIISRWLRYSRLGEGIMWWPGARLACGIYPRANITRHVTCPLTADRREHFRRYPQL